MSKFITRKEAAETIKQIKDEEFTSYYGYEMFGKVNYLNYKDLSDMFILKGFGEYETELIIASLVNSGAKILK